MYSNDAIQVLCQNIGMCELLLHPCRLANKSAVLSADRLCDSLDRVVHFLNVALYVGAALLGCTTLLLI